MRPVTLSLQAFGPFSGSELVNFDHFGVAPLFLINGPTGAGKSSLLDAICYALYGQTTGSERTGEQMRCDYADETMPTQVSYLFELRGEHYRVERSPDQLIPKKRGEGSTKQSHKAALYQLTDESEKLLASRPQIVNKMVTELLGLEVTQFRQVMVLPQGKFRELLTASSKEREQIFGQLFQTSVYSDIERALYEQASSIRSAKQAYDQQISGILSNVNVEDEPQLNLVMVEANQELTAVSAQLESVAKQYELTKNEHREALQLKQRYVTYQQAVKEQALHSQQADAIALLRAQRLRAVKANAIYPQYQAFQRAQQQCVTSTQKLIDSERTLKERQTQSRLVESRQAEMDRQYLELASLNPLQYQLEQYSKQVAELQQERQSLKAVEQRIFSNKSNVDQLDQQITHAQSKLIASEKKFEQQARQREQLPHKQAEHQKLTQQLSLYDKKITVENRLITATAKVASSLTRWQQQQAVTIQAKELATQIELSWYLNQAAELAKQLNYGDHCPVCGSCEHPQLAQFTGDPVTKADVDAAKTEWEYAQSQSQLRLAESHEAQLVQQKLEQEHQGLVEQLTLTLENAEQQQTVQQQVSQLAEQLSILSLIDLVSLEQSVLKDRQMLEQLTKTKMSFDELTLTLNHQLVEHQTKVDDREKAVPDEFKARGVVEQRLVATRAKIGHIEQLKQNFEAELHHCHNLAAAAHAVLDHDHSNLSVSQGLALEAQKGWGNALASSEFGSEELALEAYMDQESMDKLDREISYYDGRSRELHGKISTLEQDLAQRNEPDLEQFVSSLNAKEQEYNQVKDRYASARSYLDRLESSNKQLQGLKKNNAELEQQYQLLGTLSEVANGRTGAKVSLHRFVLGVLLDDVLIQATQRLQTMSRGRYQLTRKSERSKGNAGSGLDLLVEDSYSGKSRDVATLSGGESFMAALALALGLSDVVQSYSGGIQLDTLFIDEGFGSLDPDSLDLAIDMLAQLRDGGRTIGIISHVTELKEQIDTRLDISVSRQGSTITLVA
jgi:DNA repair protein SbcC/Rad50